MTKWIEEDKDTVKCMVEAGFSSLEISSELGIPLGTINLMRRQFKASEDSTLEARVNKLEEHNALLIRALTSILKNEFNTTRDRREKLIDETAERRKKGQGTQFNDRNIANLLAKEEDIRKLIDIKD